MKFTIYQESRTGKRANNEDRLAHCYSREALLDQVLDGIPANQQTDQMAQLLAPAIKAIQSAKSEDEVMGLLSEAYPQMDAGLLEQELGRLMFLADLLGRISAQEQVA